MPETLKTVLIEQKLLHREEISYVGGLRGNGSKVLRDHTEMHFKGKVQVKTKTIKGLNDTKDGVRNTQHFQNSDDKDVRNILTYRKSKNHQYDGKSYRIGSVKYLNQITGYARAIGAPCTQETKKLNSTEQDLQ